MARESSGGRAVYLGASNGDDPAAFEIFDQAVAAAGYADRSAMRSGDGAEGFAGADLILLAGGDPLLGWRAFEANGWVDALRSRWQRGSLLVGVSAGAVQLGLGVRPDADRAVSMLALAPYWIGAHEEAAGWAEVIATQRADPRCRPALALPFGAAARVSANGQFEVLSKKVAEVRWFSDGPTFRWKRPVEGQRELVIRDDKKSFEEIDHG
ncbi:MAG: Type 1 glutamine amidotransferase-like domain-containing protein [Acidobacteriota bacterium]